MFLFYTEVLALDQLWGFIHDFGVKPVGFAKPDRFYAKIMDEPFF